MPFFDLLGLGGHHDLLSDHASALHSNSGHATSFAQDGSLEFREYYAAACPHCKHLEQPWHTAESQYQGPVKWTQIECNDDNWNPVSANVEKCAPISGFPTMKMFQDGKEVDEYHGGRTADDLLNYVNNFDTSKVSAQTMLPMLPAVFAAKFLFGEDTTKEGEDGKEEGKAVLKSPEVRVEDVQNFF